MKDYLGDGVYIEQGDWEGQVILTTEDGIEAYNTIYMEKDEITGFIKFCKKIGIIDGESK